MKNPERESIISGIHALRKLSYKRLSLLNCVIADVFSSVMQKEAHMLGEGKLPTTIPARSFFAYYVASMGIYRILPTLSETMTHMGRLDAMNEAVDYAFKHLASSKDASAVEVALFSTGLTDHIRDWAKGQNQKVNDGYIGDTMFVIQYGSILAMMPTLCATIAAGKEPDMDATETYVKEFYTTIDDGLMSLRATNLEVGHA